MTWLTKLKKIGEEATKGDWNIVHPGHGERCEPAYIRMEGEYGAHQIVIDHRRDYTDPKPDADFIALSRNVWPEIIAVIEAAEQLRENWTGKSELFVALSALEKKIEGAEAPT